MLTFYCFTEFQIFARTFVSPFEVQPFQLNSDRPEFFDKLKQWKTLSINQIIIFDTVIIVTKRCSHANWNISYSGSWHVKMIFKT